MIAKSYGDKIGLGMKQSDVDVLLARNCLVAHINRPKQVELVVTYRDEQGKMALPASFDEDKDLLMVVGMKELQMVFHKILVFEIHDYRVVVGRTSYMRDLSHDEIESLVQTADIAGSELSYYDPSLN